MNGSSRPFTLSQISERNNVRTAICKCYSACFSNSCDRFLESALLRHLFEKTVARCIADGLVSGQRLAADANLIEADANKQNSTPKEGRDHNAIDPSDAPHAVREYLDVLNDAAFGAASEVEPKYTSHSHPASQWTAARKGPAFFSYSTNYLNASSRTALMDQGQCWDGSWIATSTLPRE